MEYRTIGRTGIKASVIGLGSEGIARISAEETEQVIGFAIDRGINILDCCMPGLEVQNHINRALRGKREKVLIQGHLGSSATDGQYDVNRDIGVCKKNFEALLKGLGTDYIDFGMFFFVDTDKDFSLCFEDELLRYVLDLKEKGVIRAIGASCHNSEIASRIAGTGIVDLIMFSVNPVFDMTPVNSDIYELLNDAKLKEKFHLEIEPGRARFYQLCEQRQVSITVMKTLLAGKLLSPEFSPLGRAMSVSQCIHYALTRPAVASVLLGSKSEDEIKDALRYFDKSEIDLDYSEFIKDFKASSKGGCLYCNHCQPCPQGIDIAAVTRYTDIAALNEKNIPPTVQQHYGSLTKHGSDCISCKNCEQKCPFNIPVAANMKRAADLFGF
ncbi:aldo/keto reductase [Treponema primitia]|uniref:aldo/keto reductase n=1 Tax=Treponema primitia TaxID=88058 RepID=UPI0002554DE2|nr:aldo/keto reductase [Treponema primitia]